MESFSGLGIGLSLVFGCVLLGLVAELYYLLWWRRRIASGGIEARYSKERFHMFCWKKPISVGRGKPQQQPAHLATNPYASGIEPDLLQKGYDEEALDSELMRLHNLSGPPRFLFTINEETKEDLESDDGKSRARSRSLSDFLLAVETPNLTPLASPKFRNHYGFNPLFESSAEAELNRLRSSPPPKFKFLRERLSL
ncbi:uncharacterized protein LOC127786526 [Diospyros lotus]|uniref:uncharacterized protein LOC127786526 n=1 Tax=Diospyros lotus TaxID=55363 RepID=UPI00224F5ED8|nr:uncharacterized protein LOC127786526 [Diospyros lotus]